MINYNYIKQRLKAKGFKLSEVAKLLGVQYQTLNKNLHAGSLETVKKISDATGLHFMELLTPPEGYMHSDDPMTNEWSGVIKK
ncbi:helix-turn-helix transcriptional regulator [Chryseobacterium sp.]|uniref:helix-turn-helix transcriptional regulator n=1 Tax=Chryseobacterium sp. TaxID=1871047 RepID=UPI0011C79442|nr:helix-turn-helix transcriptional regulator [Chryseobacterium sp.]TXF75922.1 helix-turn-helix transcriptional regulator [Chryseobacterium sp.]